MFTLRANQNARKRRGVSRTDMPAVRTDDSGEHEHGYRRRERGRKHKRSFPLFRASGRDLPWVRFVTRRQLARTAEPWPTGAGRPCVIAGGQYPEKASTPKRASGRGNAGCNHPAGSGLYAPSVLDASIRQGQALGSRSLRLAHHLQLEDRPELVQAPLIRSSNSSSPVRRTLRDGATCFRDHVLHGQVFAIASLARSPKPSVRRFGRPRK